MANEVSVTVTGRDRLSPEIKKAQDSADGLSAAFKRVGEIATGVFAAHVLEGGVERLIGAVSNSIAAASGLEESLNAVDQVFATSAATIHQWGEENANAFGLSRRAFNEMATPMGAVLRNLGFTQEETARQTINLTQRAADMASVFDTDVSQALEAINSALRGEANPIERYGVSVNQTTVNLRALADTGKTSAAALTEQEKATARLALIFEQTEAVAGDFANTSDSLANSQRILRAEVEEVQAKLGTALLPAVTKVVTGLRELIEVVDLNIDALGRLGKAADEAVPGFGLLGDAVALLLEGQKAQFAFYAQAIPALADLVAAEDSHTNAMVDNEAAIRAQVAGLWEASQAQDDLGGSAIDAANDLAKLTPQMVAAGVASKVMRLWMSETLPPMVGMALGFKALTEGIRQVQETAEMQAGLNGLTSAILGASGVTDAYTKSTKGLGAAQKEAEQAAKDYARAQADAAAEAQRAWDTLAQQNTTGIDQLGRALTTALQREQQGILDSTLRDIGRMRDAYLDAHNARLGQIARERDGALAAVDAQLAALDQLTSDDRLRDLQEQMALAWDPRQQAEIQKKITAFERAEQRKRLQGARGSIEERFRDRRTAAEADLRDEMARLDRMEQGARDTYAHMTAAWRLESAARELITAGELDTIDALMDAHVPEWLGHFQSFSDSVINGPLASLRNEIAGIITLMGQVGGPGTGAAAAGAAMSAEMQASIARIADAKAGGTLGQARLPHLRSMFETQFGMAAPLAGGGVITEPTFAYLGETAHARPEIVAPQRMMADTFREVLREAGGRGGDVAVRVFIGERELTDIVDVQIDRYDEYQQGRGARLKGGR